jgi:hypothetical protein
MVHNTQFGINYAVGWFIFSHPTHFCALGSAINNRTHSVKHTHTPSVSVVTLKIGTYTNIHATPGNINENYFSKILSVLSSQCSECLQMIQNKTFLSKVTVFGTSDSHPQQIGRVGSMFRHYLCFPFIESVLWRGALSRPNLRLSDQRHGLSRQMHCRKRSKIRK